MVGRSGSPQDVEARLMDPALDPRYHLGYLSFTHPNHGPPLPSIARTVWSLWRLDLQLVSIRRQKSLCQRRGEEAGRIGDMLAEVVIMMEIEVETCIAVFGGVGYSDRFYRHQLRRQRVVFLLPDRVDDLRTEVAMKKKM